jgi:hypothetical protein
MILLIACGDDGAADPDAAAPTPDATVPAPDARPTPDAAPVIDATPPPPGATCAQAIALGAGQTHSGTTAGLPGNTSASCSAGSSATPEAFHTIAAGETPIDLLIQAAVDEDARPPFDVVLSARTTCADPGTELACADSGWGERLELLGVTGDITVIVDATDQYDGATTGAYTLTSRVRDIVAEDGTCDPAGLASRCADTLRCSAGTCVPDSPALACADAVDLTAALADGTEDLTATTYAFAADHYQGSCAYDPDAGTPEHIYRLDLTGPTDLVATTDFPETNFDTYLYLREGTCDGPELTCHDDIDTPAINLKSRIEQTALPTGTYYLYVDGSSAPAGTGTYRLQITLD